MERIKEIGRHLLRTMTDATERARAGGGGSAPPLAADPLASEASVNWLEQRQQLHRNGLLSASQLKALQHAETRGSANACRSANLIARARALGFTVDDLTRASTFLRDEAPLLIHVHSNSLPSLLNDTHYRSGWERGTRLHCGNYVSCH